MRVRVDRCTGTPANDPSNGCNSRRRAHAAGQRGHQGTAGRRLHHVGLPGPPDLGRRQPRHGWFGATYSSSGNTCAGLDPNSDTAPTDHGSAGTLKQLTVRDHPPPTTTPGTADDWRLRLRRLPAARLDATTRTQLLNRLAPRLNGGDPATDPEAFGNATYLQDLRAGGEAFLRSPRPHPQPWCRPARRRWATRLGSFRNWFHGCTEHSACNGSTGWDDIAATNDPSWACRQKFLVVLTDGDDTCPAALPCSFHPSMRDARTASRPTSSPSASHDRQQASTAWPPTAAPASRSYPQNKQELVDALTEHPRARSASRPPPSPPPPCRRCRPTPPTRSSCRASRRWANSAFWAGRLDAFLKPLPLDVRGRPDRSDRLQPDIRGALLPLGCRRRAGGPSRATTASTPRSDCSLQAPHPDDVTAAAPFDAARAPARNGSRRTPTWSTPSGPSPATAGSSPIRRYPAQKYDLWNGFGIGYIVGDTASETAADDARQQPIVTDVCSRRRRSSRFRIRTVRATSRTCRSPISWATSSTPIRW